ncbi:hypothetical protein FIBSPDRAFT_279384 [Athelia psychrophila]|uniref:Uncharacterized protein n=1 Tax=Athelia psychrophila TaxID=1759441 RepID=A0A165WIX3_9AGAM|nr:hypothetical protein FIBSPDRAFT_279384 [Fibularhizoctonia sp. CBS 109695]
MWLDAPRCPSIIHRGRYTERHILEGDRGHQRPSISLYFPRPPSRRFSLGTTACTEPTRLNIEAGAGNRRRLRNCSARPDVADDTVNFSLSLVILWL